MADDPFQPLSPDGEPSVSAREIARQAAHDALAADPTPEPEPQTLSKPGSTFLDHAGLEPEPEPEPEPQTTPPAEPEPESEPTPVAPVARLTDEDVTQLAEMGIELPIAPNDVPEEFQDTYSTLVQSMMDVHAAAQARALDAQEAILRVKDFADRLGTSEGQQQLLLGVAMSNADLFNNVVEMVQRMAEDPQYADVVRRGLEADVKLEAANRRDRAAEQARLTQKGQQVTTRTERVAARLGVDPELAKEWVGARILQNEQRPGGTRDISLTEVDQVVADLARRTGAKPRPVPVQDPKTAKAVATAPPKPTPQSEPAPAPVAQPEPRITTPMDARDELRAAIMGSSKRFRGQGL